jgi:thymidylate kinase
MMRKLFKVKLQTITTASHEDSIEPFSENINEHGLAYAIRWLIAGYERYQLLKYANRLRARGYIVVCDRYPSLNEGKMDSPRIGDMHETGNLIGMMGRIEARLYNAMPVPDAVFNLTIPFNVALQRNRARIKYGKETDAQLHKRYIDNSGLLYEARYFETIDASQDLQTLLRELKRKAWALL